MLRLQGHIIKKDRHMYLLYASSVLEPSHSTTSKMQKETTYDYRAGYYSEPLR
jgi:hypothetical protein